MFCRKGVLRNFAKFTRKHLCQSLFLNKVVCLRPATLLKKRLWHKCFPVNFAKFLRTHFSTEHPRWLLLVFSGSSFLIIQAFQGPGFSEFRFVRVQVYRVQVFQCLDPGSGSKFRVQVLEVALI